MRQQSTVSSSDWFSGLIQTNHISALTTLLFSVMLTACSGSSEKTDISEEPGADGVAPTLTSIEIYDSFSKGNRVALDKTVEVEIEASESIMKPTVTIAGVQAVVSGQHGDWSAELELT